MVKLIEARLHCLWLPGARRVGLAAVQLLLRLAAHHGPGAGLPLPAAVGAAGQ